MRIGMIGNKDGISIEATKKFVDFLNDNIITEAHHGDCVGADTDFHNICSNMKINIIVHPPENSTMRAYCKANVILPVKRYLDRNRDIVDQTDILIVFPPTKEEIIKSGTWSTIRYASKNNKHILIIYSDGTDKHIM